MGGGTCGNRFQNSEKHPSTPRVTPSPKPQTWEFTLFPALKFPLFVGPSPPLTYPARTSTLRPQSSALKSPNLLLHSQFWFSQP